METGRRQHKPILLLYLLFCAACARSDDQSTLVKLSGSTMGTTYSVQYHTQSQSPVVVESQVADRIQVTLDRINNLMSTYQDDSELSIFNRQPSTDWFPVAGETYHVVRMAKDIGKRSHGALDITVGPLVNLWSFGPEARPKIIPTDKEINEARARTGLDLLEVQDDPKAIRKLQSGVNVDLSAIAKGYAVDKVAEDLRGLGITDYLVEIGGELIARGNRPDGFPWQVGIMSPALHSPDIREVIPLSGLAMATSGDYHNYFDFDGERFSHEIDPRTGKPIQHTLASVTVVADTCTEADAWATALLVLGPTEGLEVAKSEKLAVLFLVREGSDFQDLTTLKFRNLFSDSNVPDQSVP